MTGFFVAVPGEGAGEPRPGWLRVRTLEVPGYTVTVVHAASPEGGGMGDCHRLGGGAVFTAATALGAGLDAPVVAAALRRHLRAGARAVEPLVLPTPGGGLDTRAVVASFDHLADDFDYPDTLVSMLYGVLDPGTGTIDYVHADHGPAVLVHHTGPVELLPATRPLLGLRADPRWSVHRTALAPGQRLLACSDSLLALLGAADNRRAGIDFLTAHPRPRQLCAALRAMLEHRAPAEDLTAVSLHRHR